MWFKTFNSYSTNYNPSGGSPLINATSYLLLNTELDVKKSLTTTPLYNVWELSTQEEESEKENNKAKLLNTSTRISG